jgi:hypothetical protein
MSFLQRYRRLSFWNKLAALGSAASILGLVFYFIVPTSTQTTAINANKQSGGQEAAVITNNGPVYNGHIGAYGIYEVHIKGQKCSASHIANTNVSDNFVGISVPSCDPISLKGGTITHNIVGFEKRDPPAAK